MIKGSSLSHRSPRYFISILKESYSFADAGKLLKTSRRAELSLQDYAIVKELQQEGLRRMGKRYGTGAPGFRYLERDSAQNKKILWYNTHRHASEVAGDTRRLAERFDLGSLARGAMQLGACWHDIEQSGVIANPGLRDGTDELRSASELHYELQKTKVEPSVILWAAFFIWGTQVRTEGSRVSGQLLLSFSPADFPAEEAHLAAQIGASADMGRVYADYIPALGLFPQRLGIEYPNVPDLSDLSTRHQLVEFLEGQLAFQTHYRYPLEAAEALFASNRPAVIARTSRLLSDAKAGKLPSTWVDFINQQSSMVISEG